MTKLKIPRVDGWTGGRVDGWTGIGTLRGPRGPKKLPHGRACGLKISYCILLHEGIQILFGFQSSVYFVTVTKTNSPLDFWGKKVESLGAGSPVFVSKFWWWV